MRRSLPTLLIFLVVVAAVAAVAAVFEPGAWYAGLVKPAWTPPDWVFAPVWTVLYVFIAVSGWLIFAADGPALRILWLAQLLLNGAWSWLFFGLHLTGWAVADITLLLLCIIALVAACRHAVRAAAWLLLPYAFWVAYAAALNAAIHAAN